MAALTFPSPAVDGQIYPDPAPAGVNVYRYDAAYNTWRLLGVSTGVAAGTYGGYIPANPAAGTQEQYYLIKETLEPTGAISAIENNIIPFANGSALEGSRGLATGRLGILADGGFLDLLPPVGNEIGGVKQGANVTIGSNGTISVASATTLNSGVVRLNDTLSSTSVTQALTANQGRVLQEQINSLTVSTLTLCGTYNASTSELDFITQAGDDRGFISGQNLPASGAQLGGSFVIVETAGTPAPPAPFEFCSPGDWLVWDIATSTWIRIPIGTTITATQVIFNPYGSITSTNVQGAIQELADDFNNLGVTFGYVDDISTSFTGGRTSFPLTVGGNPFTPVGSNLAIFVGGVAQQPGAAYSVLGSTIRFSEAPESGASFLGIFGAPGTQGGGSPGGGTVTSVGTGTGLAGGPITSTGVIQLLPASALTIGGIKPDGSTVFVAPDGTLSSVQYWDVTGLALSPANPAYTVEIGDLNVTGAFTVTGVGASFVPDAPLAYDLGSITNPWRDLYVGASSIYMGASQLTVSGGQLLLNGTPVGGGGTVGTLQTVTDNGATTTNNITVQSATNPTGENVVIYPNNINVLNGSIQVQTGGLPGINIDAVGTPALTVFGGGSISMGTGTAFYTEKIKLDGSTGKVGINGPTGTSTLTVNGTVSSDTVTTTGNYQISRGNIAVGLLSGDSGINSYLPSPLTVAGTARFSADAYLESNGVLRFYESDNSNFVGLTAPSPLAADVTFTLPATDGTSGQVLTTDGAGILGWSTAGGTGTVTQVSTGTGLTGGPITTTGTISLVAATTSALGGVKPDGTTITVLADGTISAVTSGSGTVTQVNTGTGLTGGPITTSGTISIAAGGITNTQISSAASIDSTKLSFLRGGTGTVAQSVSTKLSEWASPQDYGAVANGTTNDLPSLQNFSAGTDTSLKQIPSGTYAISGNWTPPDQDITMVSGGGVSFSGGLPNLNSIIPYQDIGPMWSQVLCKKTYGSAWAGAGNIFQVGSYSVANVGGGPAVVSVYGGSETTASGARCWGGNFVAYSKFAGATSISTEFNCGVLAAGGDAYGVVIASAGAGAVNNAIQIQSNELVSQFRDGININFTSTTNCLTGTAFKLSGSSSTCERFLQASSIQATQAEIDLPSFQVGATPASPANRVRLSAGTAGNAATLETIGETNGPLSIRAAGSGSITLGASSSQTILSPSSFRIGGTLPGNPNIILATNGTISAINTTIQPIASERRLKENIVPVDPASSWETVKQTPLYSYNFLGHDTVSYGPIADEVPQEMVVETDQSDEEGVIRTYDNGMLHARMYVALQEALKRIESLESELASLKNPN